MRICYLVPGALRRHAPHEASRRAEALRQLGGLGVDVELRDNPDGPASIESAAEEEAAGAALQPLLPSIEDEGFEALIIGCFGDPGLHAARERLTIPVVGPAQASVHLAAQLGDRIGIVTVVDGVVPTLRRLVHGYGLEGSLAAIEAVNVPVLQLRSRRDEALERLTTAGRRATGRGADALVLGCMTMGFLDVAGELGDALGVPVVNPVQAALQTAVAMVRAGVAPSRSAYPPPLARSTS